ncbi:MAG: hypothetical protein E7069_02410 [Bacteroidales bacterium]|nr:hypothetical protein [Bacteroidales bacterium]
MTQFSTLTSAAKAIVINFFNTQMKKNASSSPSVQLMVSLYSLMPDAETNVVESLKEYLIVLSDIISEKEIGVLKAEYSAVIKYCVDYGNANSHSELSRHVPQSLIDLCMSMAAPQAGSLVYLPYSGVGSFAYNLSGCNIEGFEDDVKSWAIAQILLHSQGIESDIKLGDEYVIGDKLYDYIFTYPPMALCVFCAETITNTIHNLITKLLTNNGELYCMLPLDFCYSNNGWFEVRNILKNYPGQYSALVISFSPLMLPVIGVSLCLLRIKKDNVGSVTLMDASDSEKFYIKEHIRGYKLNTYSIIEALKKHDERYVWEGTSNQLSNDTNLLPSSYLASQVILSPKEGENSFQLSEIITIIPTEKQTDRQECPIIGMRELSSSYLNCDIDISTIETKAAAANVITSDCLLVGFIGGKFKVGRLHGVTPNSPVALRYEVTPIKISSDVITEDFLLRCIMSKQSERQARLLSTGVTITRLNKQALLSIVINVPTLKEKQDALCKEDTRSSLTDADRKIIETYEEFRMDMHMKKHAIGQTLFNLNNWWDALQSARKEGNGVVYDSATTGRIRKVSVASIYDNIQKALDQLQQQISRFDRGNGLATEEIDLPDFIENYIETHKSPIFQYDDFDAKKYYVSAPIFDEKKEELTFEFAMFAPQALTMVFDNIISNACSHGFVGREDNPEGNIIRFDLSSEGTYQIITISNNGKPVDDEVNENFVFTYSKSTQNGKEHYGIGGYEVKRLMREFGGDAEFISDPESEFPVTYKLIFYNTGITDFTELLNHYDKGGYI